MIRLARLLLILTLPSTALLGCVNQSSTDLIKPQDRSKVADLNTQMSAAGKPAAQVIPLTSLPLDDPARAEAKLQSMHKMGITGVIHSHRYADAEEFSRTADQLVELREQFNRSN